MQRDSRPPPGGEIRTILLPNEDWPRRPIPASSPWPPGLKWHLAFYQW